MTPPLMVIGFGVLEFANLMHERHLIEAGVRDAARYIASVPNCDGQKQAAAYLTSTGTIDNTGAARVVGWTLPTTDITCSTMSAQISSGGTTVTLRGQDINGNLTLVRINTTVNYANIDLGFLAILNKLGVAYSTLSFPVIHEERWYGNR